MDGLNPIALVTAPDGLELLMSTCLIWRDKGAFERLKDKATSAEDVDGLHIRMLVGPYTSKAVVSAVKRYIDLASQVPYRGVLFSPMLIEISADGTHSIDLALLGGKDKVPIWPQTYRRIFKNPKIAYVWAVRNEPGYKGGEAFYEIIASDLWGKLIGVCLVPAKE